MQKKKFKISFVFIFAIIFLMGFVSSQGCDSSGYMGQFQNSTNVTITQTCPTCSYINITIKDPESNIIISNSPMTLNNGIYSFILEKSNTTKLGTYYVEGYSNLDNPFKSCFDVTNIKVPITTQESILYFGMIMGVFLIFLIGLYFSIILPSKNPREGGYLIDIEYLKYIKLVVIVFTYLLFIWFINLMLTASNNFVTLSSYNGFFIMMFNILLAIAYPLFAGLFIIFMYWGWKDLQLAKLLTRGINPR